MNNKALIGSLALFLAGSLLLAPAEKPSFQTAKTQALGLHRDLIPFASPAVQAKITAAAKAARTYLARCGRACDLHAFLTKDIGRRFSIRKKAEVQLLEALIFGETIADMSELDQIELQNTQQKLNEVMSTLSAIVKNSHDTLKAIIQNLRG
jgi:hypothetical protein